MSDDTSDQFNIADSEAVALMQLVAVVAILQKFLKQFCLCYQLGTTSVGC